MKLADILAPECVRVPLQATTKTGAITELVEMLVEHHHISDRDAVLKAVLEREGTRSTGIGHGLAVPHCKTPACPKLAAALGKPATPLDFESKDSEPVHCVFLLVSPLDQTGPHIQALARISRLMLNDRFRADLLLAETGEQVLRVIREYDV
jgi:fructose-specific phosphotransferase system IIA component